MSYVDGFVLPVPENRLDQYKEMAAGAGKVWMKHGALLYKECVLDDVKPKAPEGAPECKFMSFPELVNPKDGETIIFAFIVYKSREHRDEVNAKVMQDPEMAEACANIDMSDMPFDVERMVTGGFKTLVDL